VRPLAAGDPEFLGVATTTVDGETVRMADGRIDEASEPEPTSTPEPTPTPEPITESTPEPTPGPEEPIPGSGPIVAVVALLAAAAPATRRQRSAGGPGHGQRLFVTPCRTRNRMKVREAVEADADELAAIAGQPADVMRNLVHDRTVRVAEPDDGRGEEVANSGREPPEDDDRNEDGNGDDLLGFVSFDARAGTIHVTQLGGRATAVKRLLAEPLRFAAGEGMNVEALVEADAGPHRAAAEAAGFEAAGDGPTFDGRRTVRYRASP